MTLPYPRPAIDPEGDSAKPPDRAYQQRRTRREAQRVRRARVRRRRLVAGGGVLALVVLVVALASGGGGDEPAPPPSVTEELSPAELSGLRVVAGWDGAEPPRGLQRLVKRGRVAGVILFADNLESPAAARRTLRDLQRLEGRTDLPGPLLVMTDQEGGQVKRLSGPPSESAEEIGDGGREIGLEQGRRTGEALADVGINVDLAPVLDVARDGGAIDREGRAFGTNAESVIAGGVDGFAAGLRQRGVVATAKHFPGLGAAETNTDLEAQSIATSLETLRAVDEAPFAAFVDRGGEMVMLSLASYDALAERPAAFSPKVVEGELRGRLGFEGVTITDGLGAAAAAAFGDRRRVALAAERAGDDLLLYSDWRAARDVGRLFARRLRAGRLDRGRFEAAAARVLALRAKVG